MDLEKIMHYALPSDSECDDVFTMVGHQVEDFEQKMGEHKGETFELEHPFEATLGHVRQTIKAVEVDKHGQVWVKGEEDSKYMLSEEWAWEAFEVVWKLRQSIVNGISSKMLN